MTDDLGEFRAPRYQRPTPRSIQAAGLRLYAYATSHNYPCSAGVLDMLIADDVEDADELRRYQRLLQWFTEQLPN